MTDDRPGSTSSGASTSPSRTAWAFAIAALIAAAAVAGSALSTSIEVRAIETASSAAISRQLGLDMSPDAADRVHQALAQRAAAMTPPDIHSTWAHARTAWQENGDDPYLAALVAYADTAKHAGLTAYGARALQRSFDRCAYCDPALSRWRVEFALYNWWRLSPALQNETRRQTAALRSAGGEAAVFAEEISQRAAKHGIDLDQIR